MMEGLVTAQPQIALPCMQNHCTSFPFSQHKIPPPQAYVIKSVKKKIKGVYFQSWLLNLTRLQRQALAKQFYYWMCPELKTDSFHFSITQSHGKIQKQVLLEGV
jgi:hypothetical protein